jgi:hypothetical protein
MSSPKKESSKHYFSSNGFRRIFVRGERKRGISSKQCFPKPKGLNFKTARQKRTTLTAVKGIKKYGFDQRSTFTSWSWKNIHQWLFSSLIYKSYKNVEKLLKKKFQKLLVRRKESFVFSS